MRKTTKLLAVSIVTTLTLSFAPSFVDTGFAGSNQSCSQRGGRNNSSTCVLNINDVTVTLIGDRSLSNNEFYLLSNSVNGTLLNVAICGATGRNADNSCAIEILNDVITVANSFNNFTLFKTCVSKGKSSNQCRSQR